jgi:hypothetical protein
MYGKYRYNAALWAALLVAVLLAGCGMQPGSTLVKYEKGGQANTTTAPKDGEYSLYATDDVTPIVKYPLSKGDKIGFEENADGTVTAIAGTNSTTIKTTMLAHNYYWKEEKGD